MWEKSAEDNDLKHIHVQVLMQSTSIMKIRNVVSSEREGISSLFVGSHQCFDLLALGENVSLQSACLAESLVPVNC